MNSKVVAKEYKEKRSIRKTIRLKIKNKDYIAWLLNEIRYCCETQSLLQRTNHNLYIFIFNMIICKACQILAQKAYQKSVWLCMHNLDKILDNEILPKIRGKDKTKQK